MRRAKSVRSGIVPGFLLLTLVSMVLLPPQSSIGAPNRQVTAVTAFSIFNMKGGDPATGTGPFPVVASTVFDSLNYATTDGKFIPSLAQSWKISPDWKTIDFFIRKDVKFHNGDPLTAKDVKYSLETHMKRELRFGLRRQLQKKIEAVEVVDPYHVRIRLAETWPWIFTNLWYAIGIFPQNYRETVGDKAFADKPVGTGPFAWVDYQQDVYFKLRSVKHHFRKTPEFETLTVRFVPEASTRLAMLQAGEADIVEVSGPHIPLVKSDPNLTLLMNKYVNAYGLWFCDLAIPNTPSPFHDIRVREAAALALDREMICKKIFFGIAEPIHDPISPLTLGYDPQAPYDPYDPKKAKALLAAAGYSQRFKTALHVPANAVGWAVALAANLTEVGIDTKIETYELGTLLMKLKAKKLRGLAYPALIWWNPSRHPSKDGTNFWTRGQVWCYNSTPEIEAAVQKGLTSFSDKELARYGREMADRMRESRVKLPLWTFHAAWGLNKRVKKWEPVLGVPTFSRLEYLELGP